MLRHGKWFHLKVQFKQRLGITAQFEGDFSFPLMNKKPNMLPFKEINLSVYHPTIVCAQHENYATF